MKKKRYYKVGEKVFVMPLKKVGVLKELNLDESLKPNYEAKVEVNGEVHTYKLYEINKLRKKEIKNKKRIRKVDEVFFAKLDPKSDAKIPSKRFEDAGYDIYACFDGEEMLLPKGEVTLVPTGLAWSASPKYYLDCKHERGSTAKVGMAVLAGVVDSGYRDAIFIAIAPMIGDVVLSKKVDKVEVRTDKHGNKKIYYPYSKAICQGIIQYVPNVKVKEISYEELEKIPSLRGKGKLGSSGK